MMTDRELSERLAYFGGIASKYGYQESTRPTEVYPEVAKIIAPDKLGLVAITDSLWGQVVDDDIVHLLKVLQMKGASYMLKWGASLSFAPKVSNTSISFHRTLKSAQFDLWCVPLDYHPNLGKNWLEGEKCMIHDGFGRDFLRQSIKGMWDKLDKRITGWYEATRSLTGVLRETREQIEHESKWLPHSPDPALVCAFTLARLGDSALASAALETYLATDRKAAEMRVGIEKALLKVAAR